MTLYTLTYDLRKEKDYQKLYAELKSFNAVKILESTWCFNRYNTSAAQLRDHFRTIVDTDDGLFIGETTNWASYNTQGTPKDL